ncbi:MAG: response regulator [bacterium]|nr:response regulator [bacterium]
MTVLAVDDEKFALAAIEGLLKAALPEAEILSFRKPSEALAAIREQPCEIAFLDIEMREMDGITLAKRIKRLYPQTNIIFTTGYSEYGTEAFSLHASGYLMKPISLEQIKEELDNLRHPVQMQNKNKIQARTFGNFEVYAGGEPLSFRYNKSKELFAYLIDREGAVCSNKELMSVLWDSDEPHLSYIQKLRKDLQNVLEEAGCVDVFVNKWGGCGINTDLIDCDYYDWIAGKPYAINAYRGEYMTQYSWAEITHGSLEYEAEIKKTGLRD